jgi:hypothetical protein
MILSLLILLILSSVLPAMSTQSSSGLLTHDALVRAHKGETILAVQRRVESLLTTKDMLANSSASRFVEFEPQTIFQEK